MPCDNTAHSHEWPKNGDPLTILPCEQLCGWCEDEDKQAKIWPSAAALRKHAKMHAKDDVVVVEAKNGRLSLLSPYKKKKVQTIDDVDDLDVPVTPVKDSEEAGEEGEEARRKGEDHIYSTRRRGLLLKTQIYDVEIWHGTADR
ncbi:MAG: hypothetical protein M1837_003271 [Sclerophora amabilis]|nr:MAG: hypothetical protein M1837_003271 [Sclerophora amabilis]